jgi:hypothetical protein
MLVKSLLDVRQIEHKISVYSESDTADVAAINIPGVEISKYRIGHNLVGRSGDIAGASLQCAEAFQDIDGFCAMPELIEADVLIMARSSFSHYAGYISDGIKLYEPTDGQLPMDKWILLSKDGSFDRAVFESQLSRLISGKQLENTIGSSESP